MFKAFVTLFSEADVLFFVLFALSALSFVLRVFFPRFGIAGIAGCFLAVSAMIERCIEIENNPSKVFFFIFWIVILLFVVASLTKLVFNLVLNKKRAKLQAIVNGEKIPMTKEGNLDYSFLVNKTGVVVSDLKPSGKVEINGKIYDVTSTKEYIFTGSRVVVSRVYAQKIIVKKI